MSNILNTPNRQTGKTQNVTSITASQRSTCTVVIYRWANTNITKLNILQANNEKIVNGTDTNGNLSNEPDVVVIKSDVVRCSVTKNKSANAGQFSITLKRGKQVRNEVPLPNDVNYLDLIHPGDWAMIYMNKTGSIANTNSAKSNSGLKMLGIVRNIRYVETDDSSTGKPRLEYVLTGDDFGAVFDMNIFFNPLVNQNIASTFLGAKFLSDAINSIKGAKLPAKGAILKQFTPDNIIKKLINFYLGANQPLDSASSVNEAWYLPRNLAVVFKPDTKNKPATSFVDILDTSKIGLHKYSGGNLTVSNLPGATFVTSLPSEGTVWSVLQFLQNSIVNEMYTELVKDSKGNLQPSLVLRQVPFSNKSTQETNAFFQSKENGVPTAQIPQDHQKTFFTDLPRFTINSSDIKDKNIGKSDFERINHLLVVPKLDGSNLDLAYASAVNKPSIQRYGLRTYNGQTSYIISEEIGDPTKVCKFFLHLIMDWFFLSHLLFNGTITIDGPDEHIEIGSNLFIKDIEQLFHVEGYNHVYEVAPSGEISYTTAITVSRGQSFQNNKSTFIGNRSKREPTTITTSVLEHRK
jgi:hypothetical protein